MTRATLYLLVFFVVHLLAGALGPHLGGGTPGLVRALLAAETAALLAALALETALRRFFQFHAEGDLAKVIPAEGGLAKEIPHGKTNGSPRLRATPGDTLGLLGLALLLHMGTALALMPFGLDDDNMARRMAGLAGSWETPLLLCAVGPLFEEVVFRHGLAGGLRRAGCGRALALGLSAAAFGLVHLNWLQGLTAFVMGLGLGGLYLGRRSLALAAAAHMLCNALAYASLRLPSDLAAGESAAPALGALGAGLTALALALLYRKLRKS